MNNVHNDDDDDVIIIQFMFQIYLNVWMFVCVWMPTIIINNKRITEHQQQQQREKYMK